MKLSILVNLTSGHQISGARAVAAGCRRHGDIANIIESRQAGELGGPDFDAYCCWGWRKGQRLHASGRNVLVMERGYLANRFAWLSLGWNGLNGRALFPRVNDLGTRWRLHFENLMIPWRLNPTGYALLMGQVPDDCAVSMIHFASWARSTADKLKLLGHEVRFRPHPLAPPVNPLVPRAEGSLKDALAEAAFAVTWNSNSGVDAVISGIPAITMDIGAMAWDVTSHDLSAPITTPDRTAWAQRMAYAQWTLEEIERGEAWEHLRHLVYGQIEVPLGSQPASSINHAVKQIGF